MGLQTLRGMQAANLAQVDGLDGLATWHGMGITVTGGTPPGAMAASYTLSAAGSPSCNGVVAYVGYAPTAGDIRMHYWSSADGLLFVYCFRHEDTGVVAGWIVNGDVVGGNIGYSVLGDYAAPPAPGLWTPYGDAVAPAPTFA